MNLLVAVLLPLCLAASPEVPLHGDAVIRFATVEEGRELLATPDAFTKQLGPLELQIRLATDKPVTADDYIKHVTGEVLPWTDAEMKTMTAVIASLRERLAGLSLSLPKQILLVQMSGRDESGAAYTRGDAIMLPQNKLGDARGLESLLAHELFHVLSRHDPEQRKKLYAIIGFTPCGGDVALPESIAPRRITNPDAPMIDYAIRVMHKDEEFPAAPILLADLERFDPARPVTLFQVWQLKLLALAEHEGKFSPLLRDGVPMMFDASDNASYRVQIGGNTGYIIHPDEVLADNFVHMAMGTKDLQSPRIVEEMRKIFTQPK
jgi:hypothetical protein